MGGAKGGIAKKIVIKIEKLNRAGFFFVAGLYLYAGFFGALPILGLKERGRALYIRAEQ